MIDYEKLKLANDLCAKLEEEYFTVDFGFPGHYQSYILRKDDDEVIDEFYNLDDLIEKLQSLTKPEPKYKVGDMVYFADGQQDIIEKIVREDRGETIIATDGWTLRSHACHSTRQALIEAQLKHWSKLYEEANPNTLCLIKNTKPKLTTTDIINSAFKQLFPCQEEPNHLWVRGKCFDCGAIKQDECKTCSGYGDMRLYAGLGKYKTCNDCNPDIKVNQSQVDVDRCQHEQDFDAITVSPTKKCIKCGEFYR